MSLDQLANIAEVFGMLVVAVTLIFLTLQMRQNTRALRSTTTQSANEMAVAIYNPIVADASLADLLLRGLHDPGVLTETEMARFTAHWQNAFFTWQNWFYQHHEGELDSGIWLGFSALLGDVFRTPGIQDFWKKRRHYFSEGFRDYLEIELLANEQTPGYEILGVSAESNAHTPEA